jgi:hypothetical protein
MTDKFYIVIGWIVLALVLGLSLGNAQKVMR